MRLSLIAIGAGLLASGAAFAAEFGPEVDRAVNACLDAARQQQVGQVTEWELDWQNGLGFDVELVAPDNRVYRMRCEGGAIVKSEQKAGNKKYEMLSTRHRVEEPEVRELASAEFRAAELNRMKYELSWRGHPYYSYSFSLPDGRVGNVMVNAATGKIDKSSSERK
ncbi:MAG: hypothetical protein IT532_15170 [Burkholderiales bacterium]|nr:hypothetical protein [Burkholderiales bacterium]